jgi:hypothetical protein
MNIQTFDIAVILIAIAQALIVLLTWRREGDIKRLHERIDRQQLLLSEIKGWLKRDVIAEPRQDKPEREPMPGPTASNVKAPEPARTPKDLPDTVSPSELKRATKAFMTFKRDTDEPREIVEAREIVAGLKGDPTLQPAITPKDLRDTIRPSTTEDELERLIKAGEIVVGPAITRVVPEPAIEPKDSSDTLQPRTTEGETDEDAAKRLTKATNWLKEDQEKAHEIIAVPRQPTKDA